jgi:glutathione synthase/RimK-type ligase-like ATP-grasp enzyme
MKIPSRCPLTKKAKIRMVLLSRSSRWYGTQRIKEAGEFRSNLHEGGSATIIELVR